MKTKLYLLTITVLLAFTSLHAGNPDRQGEAGAYELLLNPWARSAGLHTLNTSYISGVEALRLNPAGLVRIEQLEIAFSRANYLQGTGIALNSLGLSRRVGKGGAFGFSIMAMDFGDIPVTTTNQPEGTGATFSPNFFNLGISYAHIFENKVSVGITFRAISEALADVSAFGFAIDAGIQYVTGENDNFKFGISLRNVGSPMQFNGEGLSTQRPSPNGGYELTFDQRSAAFELPSTLNIGMSYDFLFGENHRLTAIGNFTSNSFSRDNLGIGLEYSLNDLFQLRAGYRHEIGVEFIEEEPIYSGLSAGATLEFKIGKEGKKQTRIGIDYAYRATRVWDGTHNIGVRINL
ncbi:MAG: PorV/PorQ family protein [Bacteroidota bacterium]